MLREDIRKIFGGALEKTLETMGWPSKELKLTGNLISLWTNQVEDLLDLQEP